MPLDIKATRKQLGLSQAALARTLEISRRTVIRWEALRSTPHRLFLERIIQMKRAHERLHGPMVTHEHFEEDPADVSL